MKFTTTCAGKPLPRVTQTGKVLPLLLVAIAAMVVGAVTFNMLAGDSDSGGQGTQQSSNADNSALAALQENLQTSLALPTDFSDLPTARMSALSPCKS